MRFLAFHDSPTRILLPSAEEEAPPNSAAATLMEGSELSGVVVSSLDLEGLSLPALAIRNCVVENANLANLRVDEMRLERVVFAGSSLVGLAPKQMEIRGALFTSCRFDYAQLSGIEVTEPAVFVSCSFREADLSGANTSACLFHDCDFADTDLTGARLAGTDLRGSTLDGAKGLSTARQVVLSNDQLADLVDGVRRDLRIEVRDSGGEPVMNWREVPES